MQAPYPLNNVQINFDDKIFRIYIIMNWNDKESSHIDYKIFGRQIQLPAVRILDVLYNLSYCENCYDFNKHFASGKENWMSIFDGCVNKNYMP